MRYEVADTVERYVLLRAARTLAAAAGDVDHAIWAIDELDRWFHINRRAMLIEFAEFKPRVLTSSGSVKAFFTIA